MMPDLATSIGAGRRGRRWSRSRALTVLGVVLISRRARRDALAPAPGRTDAGVALVRADTALRDGIDELGYAVAQFGEDRTRDFKAALDAARADLDRAFRFQQRLDDVEPDSDRQRREWTREITALADPGVDDGEGGVGPLRAAASLGGRCPADDRAAAPQPGGRRATVAPAAPRPSPT